MPARKTKIILIAFTVALLVPVMATAEEPPLLVDLSRLQLRIAKTEVVQSVQVEQAHLLGQPSKLTAKAGFKLVVVTLEGTIPAPARIFFTSREFDVFYEEYGSIGADLKSADAISWGNEWWVIPPEGGVVRTTTSFEKPGPITLKIAVVLSEQVNTFYVRYPTAAMGEAIVPASRPEPPQK